MINLKSVVDGFSVIIGPVWCNLACMLTLLITIRKPPEYENADDGDESWQAKGIFVLLIIFHFLCGLFKYLSTHVVPMLNEFTSVMMYATIAIDAILCYQWIFPRPF